MGLFNEYHPFAWIAIIMVGALGIIFFMYYIYPSPQARAEANAQDQVCVDAGYDRHAISLHENKEFKTINGETFILCRKDTISSNSETNITEKWVHYTGK